jgi:hypothetical protein
MEKKCRNCRIIKSIYEFHRNASSKDGLHTICKVCNNLKTSIWVKENLDKVVTNKKIRRKDVRKSLLEAAQNRARTKSLPIDITLDDIIVPDVCPVLMIPLQKSITGRANPNSPSLDRIIPQLGYVKGNIQVISNKANSMKNNATIEELIKFANWILKVKETNE